MRFLFVGSHLCARASFRPPLAALPLPSASSYHYRDVRQCRYSYRGLSLHQFMPMPGVIGSPGGSPPRLPQHPACGSARGASSGCERVTLWMTTSNAGYGTNRQGRFTRPGALRPLRSARLSRCRRFRPSPCPTHYGGRWATMPSADFCPITSGVAASRAVRVTVGSGGDSSAFALALSPAPLATTATVGFDGDSSPFGLALNSTPLAARTASETDLPR
jgi:hypothetical protein